MNQGRRGAFILVEGLDRSGKTTQCRLLAERLRDRELDVLEMRFPDRSSATGRAINDYLSGKVEFSDREVHELFCDNRREAKPKILNALRSGKVIVCDRYAYSGVAYSAAKGLDLQWCKEADSGLPVPDLVVFLDLAPEVARERGGYGEERYETEVFQKKVRTNFLALKDEDARSGDPRWQLVDAGRTLEEVAEEMEQLALAAVEKARTSKVGVLWTETHNNGGFKEKYQASIDSSQEENLPFKASTSKAPEA